MDTSHLQPLGVYPENWASMVFDQFTTLKRGKDLTRDQFRDGSVPVAGSNGVIGFHDAANVKAPGITVGRSGSVGRVTFFAEDFWAHNTALFVTDFHGNDARFASYFLDFLKLGRFGSGASVPTLDRNSFRLMSVVIPPLSEQQEIARVLGIVQRAMEQQERLITLTAELKKALLRQLFTRGFNNEPQKLSDIGPVPESWELVRLSDVCTFQSGGTPSKQRADYWEGTIPWVSPKDMKRPRLTDVTDHISQEALEDGSKLAPTGSVFVVVRGMILAKDIPVAIAEVPMAINQDMKAIIPGPRLHPDFLLYAMSAFKKRLFKKVGRSAHGTMTLMSSEITGFQIPLPDKETQQQIAKILAMLEKKQELHQRKHATLTALFSSLLHHLMTAQIRIPDLDLPKLESAAAA
jgi:type I restriction enzyme S subunit